MIQEQNISKKETKNEWDAMAARALRIVRIKFIDEMEPLNFGRAQHRSIAQGTIR